MHVPMLRSILMIIVLILLALIDFLDGHAQSNLSLERVASLEIKVEPTEDGSKSTEPTGAKVAALETKKDDGIQHANAFADREPIERPLKGEEANELQWQKLNTIPFRGKQDDICFINEMQGWYINGQGKMYKTIDGGTTWEKVFEKQGSFFRTIAFIDENTGFVGTVGTDYFPNVQDTIPLYKTTDGGSTWTPVDYTGPYVKGLCAIDIVKEPYINHGVMDYKYHIYAVGRVGSPANIITSHDGGQTWTSQSLQADAKMLFDIDMFDKNNGIACAAASEDISTSNALILKTADGGKSWAKVYQSSRPFETTWKVSFPSADVGYVTIQSYNPDPLAKQQRIAKTTDGGQTWVEMDLIENQQAREFGIGFKDDEHGFVGTMTGGFETKDGGHSWNPVDLGQACNKIRIYKEEDRVYGYAIGVDVLKLEEK